MASFKAYPFQARPRLWDSCKSNSGSFVGRRVRQCGWVALKPELLMAWVGRRQSDVPEKGSTGVERCAYLEKVKSGRRRGEPCRRMAQKKKASVCWLPPD